MRIVVLLACLAVVAAACDPESGGGVPGARTGAGTERATGEPRAGEPDALELLDALLLQPFQPAPGEPTRLLEAGRETEVELGEAVNDLFARAGALDESVQVRDLVWTLARAVRRGEDWVDVEGRRAVARNELRGLLGESYEDFMRGAHDLWVLAEACLPGCEEADLWPDGRPLGAAEAAMADACSAVPAFEPAGERGSGIPGGQRQDDGALGVSVATPPDGFEVADELREGGAMVSERGDLSDEAATGWHLQLAAGEHSRDDPNIQVQSVLAPEPEICHLLLRDARHADRRQPDGAAVTVRGRPGALLTLGDEQARLAWREAPDLLMEAHGYGGARPADVLAVAEALRVERP